MADIDKPKEIQVRVPDSVASGTYATTVSINASRNEVIFDFILLLPKQRQATLSSRVIVSKETAQQMADILEALLRQIKDQ